MQVLLLKERKDNNIYEIKLIVLKMIIYKLADLR